MKANIGFCLILSISLLASIASADTIDEPVWEMRVEKLFLRTRGFLEGLNIGFY